VKKLNDLGVEEQIKSLNRVAAVKNVDGTMDIGSMCESVRGKIKM
jgi:hypothetical protein